MSYGQNLEKEGVASFGFQVSSCSEVSDVSFRDETRDHLQTMLRLGHPFA